MNDNGGNKTAGHFTMNVAGQSASPTSFPGVESPGTSVTLNAGSYSVSETGLAGYDDSYSTDCSGEIAVGETKTCTVTNDDVAPTITVIKNVVNNSGGTAGANDFGLKVDTTTVNSGQTLTVNANHAYAIDEAGKTGYQFVSITGTGCPTTLGGTATLNPGQNITCTIKNDDIPAQVTVTKYNDKNGNGQRDSGEPVLSGWTFFIDANKNGTKDSGETSATTGATGQVTFANLSAGQNLQICEVIQATWANTDPGGSKPCEMTGTLSLNQQVNLEFGNRRFLQTGAKTIGFWQNKNGQGIIKNYCQPTGKQYLRDFLRQYAPFQDLSATATCTQIATYVYNIIKAADSSGSSMNPMLKAQMLATALDVYFSTSTLGGNRINAPAAIGNVVIDLTQVCTMIDKSDGSASCGGSFKDVGEVAFGGADSMTVSQMLSYAGNQSNVGGSLWYANTKSTQEAAKDAFDAINNQAAFGP